MTQGEVNIRLSDDFTLTLFSRDKDNLVFKEDVHEKNEAPYQIKEGLSYDYEFSDPSLQFKKNFLIKPHSSKKHLGRIEPNIYVGTLRLEILKDQQPFKTIYLEVQSVKTTYRTDYRTMLEDITEACTDLLMHVDSPVSQSYEVDFDQNTETLYQRFTFLKSILDTDDFREAIQRIINFPVTRWSEYEESADVRSLRRFTNRNIKDLIKGSNRFPLPKDHSFRSSGLNSVPQRINTFRKADIVDTPENRFVKYALEYFLHFIIQIKEIAKRVNKNQLETEASYLENELEIHLSHELFKEVSSPDSLPLSSPALQRKEGYREILRVWLMIDFAAKLIWEGGDDVYDAGKKNVATLYEYWLFFKLLNLFKEIFNIDPEDIEELITSGDEGLSLRLKQGKHIPIKGVFTKGRRKLNIQFSYNRTFTGSKESNYPMPGSWSLNMRPDYTLSIWPYKESEEYTSEMAEKEENIVHIHFDAKYKVNNLKEIIPEIQQNDDAIQEELDEEKSEKLKGNYKRADIYTMHVYKDAIRRTSGAYVLYPGNASKDFHGFHEIQPGLGAFPIRPSSHNTGIEELKNFILRVIDHHENRLSHREFEAYQRYKIYKDEPDQLFNESLQEYGREHNELLEDTVVLVGYIRSAKHKKIYEEHQIYNFRSDDKSNEFLLDNDLLKAKYLVLRFQKKINKLYKIIGYPKIVSKDFLIEKDYPEPSRDSYILLDIEETEEYGSIDIDFTQLPEYKAMFGDKIPKKISRINKGRPFSTSLRSLLMANKGMD